MIEEIDDTLTCGVCGNETNEPYRVGYDIHCLECLEELYLELKHKFEKTANANM